MRAVLAGKAKDPDLPIWDRAEAHAEKHQQALEMLESARSMRLMRKALGFRIDVERRPFGITHEDHSGPWRVGRITGMPFFSRSEEQRLTLAIRSEEKVRREVRQHWIGIITGLVGVLAALTGAVAAVLALKYRK
jgi:hypothetical protein